MHAPKLFYILYNSDIDNRKYELAISKVYMHPYSKKEKHIYIIQTVATAASSVTNGPVHMECRVSKHCLQFRAVFLHRFGDIVQN